MLGSKLPLFPYTVIGDGHQPNSRGLYTYIRIPIKGGMTIPNIATFDHGTHQSVKKNGGERHKSWSNPKSPYQLTTPNLKKCSNESLFSKHKKCSQWPVPSIFKKVASLQMFWYLVALHSIGSYGPQVTSTVTCWHIWFLWAKLCRKNMDLALFTTNIYKYCWWKKSCTTWDV